MPGGWGSSKNSVKIGVFWDGISVSSDGTQARITDPHINIYRGDPITDSSNNLSWSGGAVIDGSDANINVSGSGEERIKSVNYQWQTLAFGTTTKANFNASFSGINYAGGTLTVSKTVTYPARAYLIPAAPTLVDAATGRVSDTSQQIRVGWTNNPVSPSAPYTAVYVERSENGGEWVNVSGDLTSVTTAWTDAQTVVNHIYQYRVFAKNSSGSSAASAASAAIPTSPLEVGSVSLAKAGSNITVNWSNDGTYTYTGTMISANRGGVVTDYTVPSGVVTWADPAENPAVIQQYTVKHYIVSVPRADGSTFTDFSAAVLSAAVELEGPPVAPTVSVSHAVFDAADTAQVVSWIHNPVDASSQTEAEVQWRILPAGGYDVASKTTESSHTFAVGTLVNNVTYGVSVRTRGSAAAFGPWSAEVPFSTSTQPVVAVTSPSDGSVVQAAALTLTLSFTDTGGSPDADAWQVLLYETGEPDPVWPEPDEVDSLLPGPSDDAPFGVPFPLVDGTDYTVLVRARDAAGLWSEWESYSYSVQFADPVPGTIIDAECVVATGQVNLRYTIEPLDDGGGTGYGDGPYGTGPYGTGTGGGSGTLVEAISAVVQRLTDGFWVDVCYNDFSGTPTVPGVWECTDWIPPLGVEVEYRVVTHSAIPTDNEGASFLVDCTIPVSECYYPDGMRIYFNAGTDWSTQAVIVGDPSVSEPIEREKVLVTPVGRQYPIELLGIAIDERYNLSGVVARDSFVPVYLAKLGALREHWSAMALMPAPICYRDPFGKRIFGSIGGVSTDWGTTPVSQVTATLIRTGGGDV